MWEIRTWQHGPATASGDFSAALLDVTGRRYLIGGSQPRWAMAEKRLAARVVNNGNNIARQRHTPDGKALVCG
ncbi:MAG: hypothetical protein H5T92_00010 [Synergistales bacterium]|nr:hypothetical protein [Synergistales bacterium]